jgi:hypothetical protein
MICPVCRTEIILDAFDGIKLAECHCTRVQRDGRDEWRPDGWATVYPSDATLLQAHRFARGDKRRASLLAFWRRGLAA